MRRWPLVWFFGLAYAINAAAFATHLITPISAFSLQWLIGVFSPTIAAYLVAAGMGGWPQVKRLLAGYTRWRIGWAWLLAATSLAWLPLLAALAYMALGNPPRGLPEGMTWGAYLVIVLQGWLTGPLAEESGWRGFALPRLQAHLGALNASLLLGLLWAFWHVPQYLTGGVISGGMMPFPIFVPMTVALTVLFTWVFNNTHGSLVATTIMHFSFNYSGGHIGGLLGLVPPMVLYGSGVAILLLSILVVFVAGPKYLSRKPLSELPFEAAGTVKGQPFQTAQPSPARP
jgi:membrane protease YdiL (CAAX protease family)